jgi:hypothetical protein
MYALLFTICPEATGSSASTMDEEESSTDGGGQADVGSAEASPLAEHGVARPHVLARVTNVAACHAGDFHDDVVAFLPGVFEAHDTVRARRNRRSGHDPNRFTSSDGGYRATSRR